MNCYTDSPCRYSVGGALIPCISSSGGDADSPLRPYGASLLNSAKVSKTLPLLCPGLRQGSDFPRSGIAPWAAAMGHPWPGAANPASMPGCPLRNTCARPATSRNLCRPHVLRTPPESKAGCESGISDAEKSAKQICFGFCFSCRDFTDAAKCASGG